MAEESKHVAEASATQEKETPDGAAHGVTRRQFMGGLAIAGIGALLGGSVVSIFSTDDGNVGYQLSDGYLLVDTKKCAGCRTCVLSCAIAHYGDANINMGRIQIRSNPFGEFPDDTEQAQCHQCPYPSCVAACPVEAMHVDAETGVRTCDYEKCIGCERCINACPYTPSRVQWNYLDKHAQKCDLCLDAPYWNEQGGAHGKQMCVEVCPMKAIRFTTELPDQGPDGYTVNLRNKHYLSLGLPADDAAEIPASTALGTKKK